MMGQYWREFATWLEARGYLEISPGICREYCVEAFGSDVLSGVANHERPRLRSIRMLLSFQRDGYFEFRTPTISRDFVGEEGELMESYLRHLRNGQCLNESTIDDKRRYLLAINLYLHALEVPLDGIGSDILPGFYAAQGYSLASIHNFNMTFRLFLRYAHGIGATKRDMSAIVMPDNYKSHSKLPTTYNEDEIRRVIAAVERASAIGKRDYLILLLASEYGWRSSDIVSLRFSYIDWDKNMIAFDQRKTGAAVFFPLLSSVGNAVVDYLKNGRPATDAQEIIVSHETSKRGEKLVPPTIHSIVTKYMRAANINGWKQKKHGPHSLRHSLASNMLKRNVSMPIIATVLGHQSTASTGAYLSLDIGQLRKCALPMPKLGTNVFEVAT
jgi:site-specific recombinase XerD